MKSSTNLPLMGALLVAGAVSLSASTAPPKTNYDLTIGFKLTAYMTGANPPLALATKDIISGLRGTSFTNITTLYTATNGAGVSSNFTAPPPAGWTTTNTVSTKESKTLPFFSPTAKMVYRQVLSGSNVASSGIFILDGTGTNATATDVSAWVTNGAAATAQLGSGSKITTRSFDTFGVVQGAPAFIVTGVSTRTTGLVGADSATVINSLKANVGGKGANLLGLSVITNVISGSVTYSSGRLE